MAKQIDFKTTVLFSQIEGRWLGEFWINNRLEHRTAPMMSEAVAIKQLNKKIEQYNTVNGTAIPLYGKAKQEEPQMKELPIVDKKPKQSAVKKSEESAIKTPKRKPFTPYGLHGYLVDKNGNIRLHLDRKANAQTIVLTPTMFAMLADMVKATQGAM